METLALALVFGFSYVVGYLLWFRVAEWRRR
jgi:hypothetical protein